MILSIYNHINDIQNTIFCLSFDTECKILQLEIARVLFPFAFCFRSMS